jgi:hypothetical protein
MRRLLLISLLTALAPCANAQHMGSASPRFAAGFNRSGFTRGGLRSSFYSLPLYDPLYADYLSSTGYPVASQPQLIILQSPPAAAPAPDRPALPSQPLMIELQGDRYVRVSGPETSGAEMIGPDSIRPGSNGSNSIGSNSMDQAANRKTASAPAIHTPTAPELPPAVLIFRDGHHEEASEYTIADGILYTRGDPYSGAYWNRKINLSSLNLPETIASNQARGLRFRVPVSPNEVIVRP